VTGKFLGTTRCTELESRPCVIVMPSARRASDERRADRPRNSAVKLSEGAGPQQQQQQ